MTFTHYATAKEFSADVSDVLKMHEIQNNLLLKNIGDGPGKIMAAVKDDSGNVLLTAIRTVPFPMVMYGTGNLINDRATKFLAESFVKYYIDVNLVMAEKLLVRSFCQYYGSLTGKKYRNDLSLVLYVTGETNEIPPVSGDLRKADARDMFYLPYWYADFAPACNLGGYNLEEGIKGAGRAVENGTVHIWEDGYPVSAAAHVRSTSDCAFLGHVYTPPNLRGRGYGTSCVAAITRKLLDSGFKHCALYADCANPYSNRIYQKVGYKQTFWYDQYRIEGDDGNVK